MNVNTILWLFGIVGVVAFFYAVYIGKRDEKLKK